ncbi:protein kinase [Streptomyces sp. NPDC057136]|uniref:protein kinase domain-containing protein n=1 Tax=Streptomyces sp. NPDC057136 TaxID=3346029 RepID=UPI003631049A
MPGITLSDALRLHDGPLPGDALWRLLRDAASGLRAVHAAGIVHRDLKPSNVMLTLDGVTLIDFGVARAADQSRLTKTGMVVGAPAYMAPEQAVASRRLTGAVDVFALGSLLLFAANGRPPFGDGSGLDLLYRIVHEEPDFGRMPETHPDLAAIAKSCLAKDPADRPTTDELFALAAGHVPTASSSLWPPVVTDRITEREAFATNPPAPETPPPASSDETDGEPTPAAIAIPEAPPAEPASTTPPKAHPRRRRVLIFALPVVVVTGTTLTVALTPLELPVFGARPGSSSPPTPGTPSDATAGGHSSKPTTPSSGPSGSKKDPNAASSPAAPKGGDAGGAGAGAGAGDTNGSGGSSGSSTSGASNSSGGSGTPDGPADDETPSQPVPSGKFFLKNSSHGRCIAESVSPYGGNDMTAQECGAPSKNGTTMNYTWAYSPRADGTLRIVNKGSGKCLEAKNYAGSGIETCTSSATQAWTISTKTSNGHTLKSVSDGTCLSMTSYNAMPGATCDPQDSSQLWLDSTPV